MAHTFEQQPSDADLRYEDLVERYYTALYQFAYSLTRSEADACDLTQQTFYTWSRKGHQLKDKSKVKTWLFTTLHHEFLRSIRRFQRFPHQNLDTALDQLPSIPSAAGTQFDGEMVMSALQQLHEDYRAPLSLYYMEQVSYNEIAEILGIPLGTVRSRIARAKAALFHRLQKDEGRHE